MKFAVISDTHGNVANFRKAINWLNNENIHVVLHCGDIGNPESLKESLLDFKGEFFGVFGNMDKDFKLELQEYQSSSKIKVFESIGKIKLGDKKISFTHFPDEAKKLAQSAGFDMVFYGHTHRAWDEKVGDCHMINPGELAGQFYKPTFAVYDTDTEKLELKILEKL
jgi:hypothetical protein